MEVSLCGGVNHVRVRRFPDELPSVNCVLDADGYLAKGVDSGGYAATTDANEIKEKSVSIGTQEATRPVLVLSTQLLGIT